MTTFFHIGQRVKLARPLFPKNAGLTGIIVYLGPVKMYQIIDDRPMVPVCSCNCAVRFDDNGISYPQHTDQLEPIVPDGLESPEQIKELYTPEEEFCYVS